MDLGILSPDKYILLENIRSSSPPAVRHAMCVTNLKKKMFFILFIIVVIQVSKSITEKWEDIVGIITGDLRHYLARYIWTLLIIHDRSD